MKRAIHYLAFAFALEVGGATYYVDFDTGSNTNPGTSSGVPWKHCPGDTNATDTAASTSLVAGDTVIFKGGVAYRGNIFFTWSGNDGSPITFDGNTAGTWGTGKAIIDGADIISTTWTNCPDAAGCGGSTNFANIWFTDIPAGVSNGWPHLLVNGTNMTHTAQHPNPSNRFLWDDTSEWRSVAFANVTTNTLADTSFFTQSDSTYWSEAWIGMRGWGNSMNFRLITNFNTGTDAVSFPSFINYDDRNTEYAVFNLPTLIDQPGEHAVSTNSNRLYLWPPNSIHPSNYTFSVAKRLIGFYGLTRRNITIQGFVFRGFYAPPVGFNEGGAAIVIVNSGTPGDGNGRNNKAYFNDIRFMKSMIRRSLITLNADTGADASHNTMAYSFASGIRMSTGILKANSNSIDYLTGTGIFFQGAQTSIIKGNSISNLIGTHANGISVYSSSKDVEVSFNRVVNVGSLMTFEFSTNLNAFCNYVDAVGKDQRINEWGGMAGTVRWFGNTLVNNSEHRILNLGVSSTATYEVRNNIIDGGGAGTSTRTHNIYLGRHFWQESPTWELDATEIDSTEAAVFVSAGSDRRLKAGSPAIDAGTDLSSYYTLTIDGQTITGTYDVGAFGAEGETGGGGSVVNGVTAPGHNRFWRSGGMR